MGGTTGIELNMSIIKQTGAPGKSEVARNLASIAERNLANFALQAVHECRRATTVKERDEIANVGILIARARQVILPVVLEAAK